MNQVGERWGLLVRNPVKELGKAKGMQDPECRG